MTRRQGRYERRNAIRAEKRAIKLQENLKFENVCSHQALFDAAMASSKGVRWKASVQRYLINVLFNVCNTRKNLLAGKDVRKGFIEFNVCERGKVRHIKSIHFDERVVQKSLCSNALYPVLTYNLIEDNGASQKGKGTHYAIKRLVKSLVKHYKKFGNSGYVLLIDFKSYFDNVAHQPLKEIYRKYFEDKNIVKLADDFLDAFGDRGLGLGSETSQISAVAYINEIDHFIKEAARIKGYGRYMDDSYIIHQNKEYLQNLLKRLKDLYKKYGIKLNTKKTHIVPLKRGFCFLKTRFYISGTGKIIKKPCRDSVTRERRKLKRQAKLYAQGQISLEAINISYQSWKGSMKHRDARKTVHNMEKLYKKLFNKEE